MESWIQLKTCLIAGVCAMATWAGPSQAYGVTSVVGATLGLQQQVVLDAGTSTWYLSNGYSDPANESVYPQLVVHGALGALRLVEASVTNIPGGVATEHIDLVGQRPKTRVPQRVRLRSDTTLSSITVDSDSGQFQEFRAVGGLTFHLPIVNGWAMHGGLLSFSNFTVDLLGNRVYADVAASTLDGSHSLMQHQIPLWTYSAIQGPAGLDAVAMEQVNRGDVSALVSQGWALMDSVTTPSGSAYRFSTTVAIQELQMTTEAFDLMVEGLNWGTGPNDELLLRVFSGINESAYPNDHPSDYPRGWGTLTTTLVVSGGDPGAMSALPPLVSGVPEPSSYGLMSVGVLLVVWSARRQSRLSGNAAAT